MIESMKQKIIVSAVAQKKSNPPPNHIQISRLFLCTWKNKILITVYINYKILIAVYINYYDNYDYIWIIKYILY